MTGKASVRFLRRAVDDLQNICAYWRRNIPQEEAHKIITKIIRDLKELALFYPAAEVIKYEPLNSSHFRFYRSGAYICICKKIEDIIYVYHIAHEDSEYPEIFARR